MADPNDFWHVKKLASVLRGWGYVVLQRKNIIVAIDEHNVYVLDFNLDRKVLTQPKKLHVYKVNYVNDDKFKSFIAKLMFEKEGKIDDFPFAKSFEITS